MPGAFLRCQVQCARGSFTETLPRGVGAEGAIDMVDYTPEVDAAIAATLAANGIVTPEDMGGIAPGQTGFLRRYALEHQFDQPVYFDGLVLRIRAGASMPAPATTSPQAPYRPGAYTPSPQPSYPPVAPADLPQPYQPPVAPVTPPGPAAPQYPTVAVPPAPYSGQAPSAARLEGDEDAAYQGQGIGYGEPIARVGPSPVDIALSAGPSKLDTERSGGKVPLWWWLLPTVFLLPGGLAAWWFVRETNRTIARWLLWTGVALTVVTALTIVPTMGMVSTTMKQMAPGGGVPAGSAAWPASTDGLPTMYFFGSGASADSQALLNEITSIESLYDGKVDFRIYGDLPNDPAASKFAAQHAVKATPTTVIVGGDAREQARWTGPVTEAKLRAALDAAAQ